MIKCKTCGFESEDIDDFDVVGACCGNLFCNQCGTEFDDYGLPALLCGDCAMCRDFLEDGVFERLQQRRINERRAVTQTDAEGWHE